MDNEKKEIRQSNYEAYVMPRLEEIKHWCREGLTDAEIAKRLGVAARTFTNYKRKHKDLMKVIIEGKSIADYRVEDALYKRALGYQADETTRERKFNKDTQEYETVITKIVTKEIVADPTSMIWWLKNRKPETWRDRQEINIDGKLDIETKYSHLSDEDLEKEVNKMKKVLDNE